MSSVDFENNAIIPCKSQHKFGGKILSANDIDEWDNKPCDCGKFIVKFESCGCPGAVPKPRYYENPNYIPSNN